jgi:hypothetical protein
MHQTNSSVDVQHNVKFSDRNTTIYSEGSRSVAIPVEYLGNHTVLLYLKNLDHWDSPQQPLPLTLLDKDRIRSNVRKAYALERMMVQFDDEPLAAS